MIVYNAIQTPDGTILESRYRHQYIEYVDANGKLYMVDGGLDYLRRSSHSDQIELSMTDREPFEKVREVFTWGTYGQYEDQPLRFIVLKDLNSEHIEMILKLKYLSDDRRRLFEKELEYRGSNRTEPHEDNRGRITEM